MIALITLLWVESWSRRLCMRSIFFLPRYLSSLSCQTSYYELSVASFCFFPWTLLSVFVYRVPGGNPYLALWTSISFLLLNLWQCLFTILRLSFAVSIGLRCLFYTYSGFSQFSFTVYPCLETNRCSEKHSLSSLCYGSSFASLPLCEIHFVLSWYSIIEILIF